MSAAGCAIRWRRDVPEWEMLASDALPGLLKLKGGDWAGWSNSSNGNDAGLLSRREWSDPVGILPSRKGDLLRRHCPTLGRCRILYSRLARNHDHDPHEQVEAGERMSVWARWVWTTFFWPFPFCIAMPHEPVLLANVGKKDGHTLAVYQAGGGYRGLAARSRKCRRKPLWNWFGRADCAGRGGAGFPTGLKWSFLPENHPGPVYLCVNGDESEPGTFVNRIQMELDPHQVLEGIILSCYATKATTAYVYLRYEYPLCLKRMQTAIDECLAAGLLGRNILGSNFWLDVRPPARSGGLCLRRRNRTDREHPGALGMASNLAAVSGRRRAF